MPKRPLSLFVIAGYDDGELVFVQGHKPDTGLPIWTSDIAEAKTMPDRSAFWCLYVISRNGAPDVDGVHAMTYADAAREAKKYV